MLSNIQALRCIAAVWVAIYHMQPSVTPFRFTLLPDAVSSVGFAGVDLFFVISGFIMAETTRQTPAGWRPASRFLLQRFGRIYIGWWPFFVLYLVGATQLGKLRPDISLWGSFLLWPQDLMQYLLPITWTLSFELYFYLGVALLLAWNRRHATSVLALAAIAIVAFNAWAHHGGLYLPENEAQAKKTLLLPFYLSPLVLEFIGGFLLSGWLQRRPRQSPALWLLVSVLLLCAAHYYQTYGPMRPGGLSGFFHASERALLLGGGSIGIVAFAVLLERRGITAGSTMRTFGDASYCFYLAHIAILQAAARAHTKLQVQFDLPEMAWGLGAIGATLALSWLFHRAYERPLNLWLKTQLARVL